MIRSTNEWGGSDETFALGEDIVVNVAITVTESEKLPRAPTPNIPGYELVRILGEGGMGVVWEAREHRLDRKLALKVLRRVVSAGEAQELWAEAYTAAKIGDPGIVRVHDIGLTLTDQPFYSMDYVEGSELAAAIAEGPMAARQAVSIAIDIARAAAAAHEHGIIHCDLKPRNVLLDTSGRARILDFGIAHSASRPSNRKGQIEGTPGYMAPEQALGSAVGPATDVYAIGVLLYEMLAGVKPFRHADPDMLLAMVRTSPAPPLRESTPTVSAELATVVARCLEKSPDDRFSSARSLLLVLVAIHEGRAIPEVTGNGAAILPSYAPRITRPASNRPPAEKPRRADAKKHFEWSWKLRSSPEKLWPWVANTDRFNRSIGMQDVEFSDEVTPDGTSERSAKARTLGMQIQWREFPFEWIKNREHSVFRWYRTGPIDALWNRVRLAPLPGGGTELTHEIWISPRGIFGALATSLEVGQKTRRNADRSYRRVDAIVSAGNGEDPYDAPHVSTPAQREVVLEAFDRLIEDGFPRNAVDKLANHLLTAPGPVVAVLRPFPLADAWNLDRSEMLDLFLHAAHLDLLEIAWDVICPKCLLAHETVNELAKVKRTGICEACVNTFERDLSTSVELVFRPSARLRETERMTYCAGAPALRPHVLVQQVLEPGETRSLSIDLKHGTYRLAAAFVRGDADLAASAVGYANTCTVAVLEDGLSLHPSTVLAGETTLHLYNSTNQEQTIRLELPGSRRDGVTAATAVTHPTFREFFSGETPGRGERLIVGRLAFLFVQTEDRARVLAELGDDGACELFEGLDQLLRAEMARHEGSEAPAALGLFVGAFPHAQLAASAALAIARDIRAKFPTLGVRLAVHEGPCVAIARGNRLEYFGETIDRGVALLIDAPLNGIAMSAGIVADRRVATRLYEQGITAKSVASVSDGYAGRRVTAVSIDTSSVASSRS